jgi:hypothetical protein
LKQRLQKAKPQLPRKPKLLRSNPLRKSLIIGGSDPYTTFDDEDVYIGYRRPELVKDIKIYKPDEDLPEDIEWKLFLIRQVALAKYRETQKAT